MTTTAPSFIQIKAQVATIRQKVSQEKPIGIHSLGRWTGETEKREGDQVYAIHQCDSPLAMRLALREPVDEHTTKVLITGLNEIDLGDDILLRLVKRRLFPIDPWEIVRSLFHAHAVDPRLTKQPWIAEALLELIPQEGYPAARGGFLDSETVWPLLLERAVGLRAEAPDLNSLLKWSLDSDATNQFRHRPESFRQSAAHWLGEKAGPAAKTILHCIEGLIHADAVPIGLAAGVVYHPAALGKLEKAAGKFEQRFLGGASPDIEQMHRWSAAATEVVRGLRHTALKFYRQTIQRADEILRDIQADHMAYLSDTSSLGFDQRLTSLGESLSSILANDDWGLVKDLVEARNHVCRHDQAGQEERRLERVEMALRLVRWLMNQSPGETVEPESFAEAANAQLREGGFVDWARLTLRSGDPIRELSEGYAKLFGRVREVRERESRVFAKLLVAWTEAGSQGDQLVPVERVLEEVVAPLAADAMVLVIVIDGMSTAVCRELMAGITKHEWTALAEPGRNWNRPGLATLPSVTEFSRTSLLCGRLCQGTQEDEKKEFAKHPTLVANSRSGSPPILFHKSGLQDADDTTLATEVRKEIASTHRRVVGFVVNAVDDHLLKGEQIDTRWARDEIRALPALLHEARIARRLVVLLSDHGHVLDCQAEGRAYKDELTGGERWRSPNANPEEAEILVQGSRVLVEENRLIAPWSERIRYGMKKNGYHGGLSPQEMVVPIAVLSSTDDFPKGWQEQPVDTPVWWDETVEPEQGLVQPLPALKPIEPVQPKPTTPAGMLFDPDPQEESVELPQEEGGNVTNPDWIVNLLASPVFADQKRLGGRNPVSDELFGNLLRALDRRGGKMLTDGLARELRFSPMRIPGLLARAERVLNVDGYDILRRDNASNTVELNRDLLLKQFDLI